MSDNISLYKTFDNAGSNDAEEIIHSLYPTLNVLYIEQSFPVLESVSDGVVCSNNIYIEKPPSDKENGGILMSKNVRADILGHLDKIHAIITLQEDKSSHLAIVSRSKGVPIINITEDNYNSLLSSLNKAPKKINYAIDTFTNKIYVGDITINKKHVLEARKRVLHQLQEDHGLNIYANADTAQDISSAVEKGYKKSWPRSETLLYENSTLQYFNAFLLSPNHKEAAEKFINSHSQSIMNIYKAAKGSRVVFRLLDPPSHEFLPKLDDTDAINNLSKILDLSAHDTKQLLIQQTENNPMIGHRGARLLITHKPLLMAQINSLLLAWNTSDASSRPPTLEILVPFIMVPKELTTIKDCIYEIAQSNELYKNTPIEVGCMIEIPSILFYPDEIAINADFISFGTNDLVATTYAISRGDSYNRYLNKYIDNEFLEDDPFFILPQNLLRQINDFALRVKEINPSIKIDICGEQALSTDLTALIENNALDSVSIGTESLPIFVTSFLRNKNRRANSINLLNSENKQHLNLDN